MAALAERQIPSFGSGEQERPWTGVSGPWVHKWRASKEMGFVRGVRSAGYILGLAPGSSTHRCWRGVCLLRNWRVAPDSTSSTVSATSGPS